MNPTIGVLIRINTVLMPQYTTTNGINGNELSLHRLFNIHT
jgi:hypothetical protein